MPNILKKAAAFVLTTAVICGISPITTSASDTQSVLNDKDWVEFVEEKIEQDSTPGLSLSVVNGSEIGYKNWGYDNIADKTPVTENTAFRIGSLSKSFTALTIFLLQEEGKLSIEDSVSDHLPWWNVTWQGESYDTKIWQLLNHCSGIPNSTMMKSPVGTDNSLKEQNARIAENLELTYEPSTAFEYCNLGYDILAYITETVSGITFEEYVEQEIFSPLGMNNSGYDIQKAQSYRWFFGQLTEYAAPPFTACNGSGELISTAEDMTLWMNAQLGNGDIPEKLKNAISASHETPENHKLKQEGQTMNYFNGWMCFENFALHSGSNPDFSAYIIIDYQRNIGIFTVSNAMMNTADYAANSLYSVIKGENIDRERLNILDLVRSIDILSMCMTVAGTIASAIAVFLLITQKKRLAKKQTTYKKEIKKLCVRLTILIPVFCIACFLPTCILYLAGYGIASYRMLAIWLPYSFIIGCIAIDIFWLLLIISSVIRFIRAKKSLDS